jgi:Flp pilus assembly protein TadD
VGSVQAEFSDIVAREPQNISARIVKAILEHTQGKKAEAKQQYQEVLKMAPHAAVAANNLAWLYVEEGENLHVALKLAEGAARDLPNSGSVHHTLGWVHARQGSKTWAIRAFEQSVAKDPNAATYRYDLGRAYAEAKDFERARSAFEATLKLDDKFTAAQRAIERLQN